MPVKVYPYKMYDVDNDKVVASNYLATPDAIKLFNGTITDRSDFYYVNLDVLDEHGRIDKDKLCEYLKNN